MDGLPRSRVLVYWLDVTVAGVVGGILTAGAPGSWWASAGGVAALFVVPVVRLRSRLAAKATGLAVVVALALTGEPASVAVGAFVVAAAPRVHVEDAGVAGEVHAVGTRWWFLTLGGNLAAAAVPWLAGAPAAIDLGAEADGHPGFVFGMLNLASVTVFALYGADLLRRRSRLADAAAHAAALEASRAEERRRIARDLHDVVSHQMAIVAVQAQAAEAVVRSDQEAAARALAAIAEASKRALAEMRTMLDVLRADAGTDQGQGGPPAASTAPQPTLDEIDRLVERARRGGIGVTLVAPGCGDVDAGVAVAAYRIVQEALTNTAKHAPGADALVELRRAGDELLVEVTDTGGARRSGSTGDGRGLLGMAERAAAAGGTLTAGPTAAGGWEVVARLPLRTGRQPAGL